MMKYILSEDMHVYTNDGIKQVKNLNEDDIVYDGNSFAKLKIRNIGTQQVNKITTVRGYSICGNFSLDTIKENNIEQKSINDFNKEDTIISHVSNVFSSLNRKAYLKDYGCEYGKGYITDYFLPTEITPQLAYLLGYSYGDGYLVYKDKSYHLSLSCSDDYPDVAKKLTDIIKNVFGYTARRKRGDGKLDIVFIQVKPIIKFLIDNNIAKQKAGYLNLPEQILNTTPEILFSFFSGHFDADGYNSGHKKGYCLYSIDKDVLLKYQLYLSLNNIVSTIKSEDRTKQGWQTMWSLHIYGTGSQKHANEKLLECYKIQNKPFEAFKDFVKVPYTPKMLNLSTKKCRIDKNTNFISFGTAQLVSPDKFNTEFINHVDTIESNNEICYEIETDGSIWSNGFVLK